MMTSRLQRRKEGEQRLPVPTPEILEPLLRSAALAVVGEDRLDGALRAAVVQEARRLAQAPERRRAHLRRSRGALDDAVAQRAHVVQQKVGEGVILDLVERVDRVPPGDQGR